MFLSLAYLLLGSVTIKMKICLMAYINTSILCKMYRVEYTFYFETSLHIPRAGLYFSLHGNLVVFQIVILPQTVCKHVTTINCECRQQLNWFPLVIADSAFEPWPLGKQTSALTSELQEVNSVLNLTELKLELRKYLDSHGTISIEIENKTI